MYSLELPQFIFSINEKKNNLVWMTTNQRFWTKDDRGRKSSIPKSRLKEEIKDKNRDDPSKWICLENVPIKKK